MDLWKEKGAAGAHVGNTDGAHSGGREEGNRGRGREIAGEREEEGGLIVRVYGGMEVGNGEGRTGKRSAREKGGEREREEERDPPESNSGRLWWCMAGERRKMREMKEGHIGNLVINGSDY